MNKKPTYQKNFDRLNCCVIIPTYNNQNTLARVLNEVLQYTRNLIVINDGSTDKTSEILDGFPEITRINFMENKGKGKALLAGFKKAEELGYEYAITIDSDGQHFAEDMPTFLTELEANNQEPILIIGSRKMDDPEVPNTSSFGNKFSSFWVWIETGINLEDTQCGLRLYPLKVVNNIKLLTPKFEFEIEIIVKTAWRKIPVKNIPVKVLYDPDERVTHFRPVIDIVRITLLNIWFVIYAFLFVIPQKRIRQIKEKGGKRIWKEDILKIDEPPLKKALAIALGVFIGIAPFWGLQTLLVFFLAQMLGLNKLLAFVFSNVSIPPFIPFILYASYQMGALVTGEEVSLNLNLDKVNSALDVLGGMKTYLIGSFILAGLSAFCSGLIFYLLFSIFKPAAKKKLS